MPSSPPSPIPPGAPFERLCHDGDQGVAALAARAGVSRPAVPKHPAVLRRAGLVEGRPLGRQTRYRARPEALAPLADWTARMAAF